MPEPRTAVADTAGGGRDPLAPYDAVLILSYGGPAGEDDVLPFMRNATAGRGVPDSRLLEVSGHYARFGGVSPINARNAELVRALRLELARRGSRVPVIIGNRNWHPFVSEALRELADGGARRILSMTTSAYGSYSGCRQYREDTEAAVSQLAVGSDGATGRGKEADAAARVGGPGGAPVSLRVDKTRPFYNTPGMLAANADAIVGAVESLLARGVPADGIRLVLVTHSIPEGMEKGSSPQAGAAGPMPQVSLPAVGEPGPSGGQGAREPGMAQDLSTEISYVEQHRSFIRVLVPVVARRLERLGISGGIDHDLVYCSRSGPPQARWLEPDVNDHLEALAEGRLTDGTAVARPAGVVVAPIGFVADHMEVVFDLDTEARETAERLDMPYVRAATAGCHPDFVASLVDLLLERAAVERHEEVAPVSTTGTGPFHTVCPQACCRAATRPPGAHAHGAPGVHGAHGPGQDAHRGPAPSSARAPRIGAVPVETGGRTR